MGYTDGYKKTSSTKRAGDKSHFFSEIVSSFSGKNGSENSLTIKNQHVSNDKYLKLYRIKSNLVDYNQDNIENSLSFTREDENFFLGVNASIYENLKENYNDKYEYILPEITFDKNLVSNDFIGNLDLQSNLKVRNYDTNKTSKFFINDLDWNFKNFNSNSGLTGKLIGKVKNINYEAKNITTLKETTVNELHGALGYLTKLELFKKNKDSSESSLIPKLLLRYAPGSMRKEESGSRMDPSAIFSLDRLNNQNNFESGSSATLGFDYELTSKDKELVVSMGQVFNAENNKKMHSKTSLDQKISDLVGTSSLKINDNVKFKYNFSLDHNYNDFNYNEVSALMNFDFFDINFDYIQEKKHLGNEEYFKNQNRFQR